ncbi:MAG: hypothetical protein R6U89_00040, partial [Dehalococcoidia bacterium]
EGRAIVELEFLKAFEYNFPPAEVPSNIGREVTRNENSWGILLASDNSDSTVAKWIVSVDPEQEFMPDTGDDMRTHTEHGGTLKNFNIEPMSPLWIGGSLDMSDRSTTLFYNDKVYGI